MAYEYIKNHTLVNFSKGNDGRNYIVLHYTGNHTDTAKNNSIYFHSVNRSASAHLFVDENFVYEVVGLSDTAWAVGKDYGGKLFGKCSNRNSINIEMCSTNGKISKKTLENTVKLTKKLMKTYNIPESHVVRHYDVCKKNCPGWSGWTGKDSSKWENFKKRIAEPSETEQTDRNFSSYKAKITAESGLVIRKKASANSAKIGVYKKGAVITIRKENNNGTWGKTKKGWIKLAYVKKMAGLPA